MGVVYEGALVDVILYNAYHDCASKGKLVPGAGGMRFDGPIIQYPHVCTECGEEVMLSESVPAMRFVPAGTDLSKVAPFVPSTIKTERG